MAALSFALSAFSFVLSHWRIFLLIGALGGSFVSGYRLRVHQDDSAQVTILKNRLLAVSMIQANDAQRATADQYFLSKMKGLALASPVNTTPCFDAATAHRVWTFRQTVSGAAPVPARRISDVLQRPFKRP